MKAYHPYRDSKPYTRWSKSVAELPIEQVDPDVNFPFRLGMNDRVATAGSCFAQHIARKLQSIGCNYYVTEKGHPIADEAALKEYNFGTYSARFGNIYTARQLLQLMRSAFKLEKRLPEYWQEDGCYIDPYRPNIQPNGFSSLQELRADREQHYAFVREMFLNLDYFVFTLGLTEAWTSNVDGTVFPLCPGVAGGTFDSTIHKLMNFKVSDVVDDMGKSIDFLLSINPRAKVILTVSPVPLIATAVDRHVLVSTTYSKSVLRVACEQLCETYQEKVAYFPSYEIITGGFNRGSYFEEDLRSVTKEGVDHVMRTFVKNIDLKTDMQSHLPDEHLKKDIDTDFFEKMKKAQDVVCEEELIEASLTSVV